MVAIMATTTATERKKMKGDDRLIIAIILDIIAITFVFKIHKKTYAILVVDMWTATSIGDPHLTVQEDGGL